MRAVTLPVFVLLIALAGGCGAREKPYWTLSFDEEFNGPSLDPKSWDPHFDTDPAMPAHYVIRDGGLHLLIDRDAPPPRPDGKGRVSAVQTRSASLPLGGMRGRVEIRARCAKGSGLCSLCVLKPADPAYLKLESAGGTRASAEEPTQIDVFEHLGKSPTANNFNAHYGRDSSDQGTESQHVEFHADLTAEFHTYTLEWDAGSLTWRVDGREVQRSERVPHASFLIELALFEGGSVWRGPVDAKGPFPHDFEIDYVRIYQWKSWR